MIPDWTIFGLLTAATCAAMVLLQERLKVEGFALAVWCKIVLAIVTFPFMLRAGLPQDPLFYLFLFVQASMFAVADVLMFRVIPVVGGGVYSRLKPLTVVAGFLLWFAVRPSDLAAYADRPLLSAGIVAALAGTAFFAARLKACTVSREALRLMWPLLVIFTLGTVNAKLAIGYATPEQGLWAYPCIEAFMMLGMWMSWLFAARPVPPASLLARKTILPACTIGLVMAAFLYVMLKGLYSVDNPGYIFAVALLSSVMILAVHRLLGKDDGSDVKSGLGVVACAALLIVLKAQVP